MTAIGQIEAGVWDVLTGCDLDAVAARLGVAPAQLRATVRRYRRAGRRTLRHAGHPQWRQIDIDVTDRQAAENALIDLDATLHATDPAIGWWFVRKTPTWRLRWRPSADVDLDQTRLLLRAALDRQIRHKRITGYRDACYEPETEAFGGAAGMRVAHHLFAADTRHIMAFLRAHDTAQPRIGRAEISILLCGALFRAAGQEWNEQGAVWAQVARNRPSRAGRQPPPTPAGLMRLLRIDAAPRSQPATTGPLTAHAQWINAFDQAGRSLAQAARVTTLSRGMRAILATHVLFHWNRLGLPDTVQIALARGAQHLIPDEPNDIQAGTP